MDMIVEKQRLSLLPVTIAFLLGGIFVALIFVGVGSRAEPASRMSGSGTLAPLPVIASQDQLVIETVKRAEPAVVSVIITKDLPKLTQVYENVVPEDPFFRGFSFQIPRMQQQGTEKREVGGGTAFFVSSDGLLMTNKHVADDEKAEYTILLNDGKKIPAKVVARDPVNDIALLKVEGSDFTALPITATDDASLGQTVIAIGNALGEFRNTVSVGVISGLQRSITAGNPGGDSERLDQIIQTDAAINSGNSGGPLLSAKGEVIGMNTAVSSVGQNIGFALPARELRRVLSSYQKNGRIVRPYIGVRYMPITPELQEKNKLPVDYGVLVVRGETAADLAVMPDSPADRAGLQENDIILDADGQKLIAGVSLQQIIINKSVGDTLRLKVLSKGKEKTVTVTLEEWKE
ncbi:MAG: trypsin-like peptidase domain-containing protein [Candidatus Peribacteraceae bacterium]|nr:trypsin-like peptidase domain-containing protein [Candidatus Peribacteraceae bacterium]MDD5742195.1 trypsin-like peptidase domain-containing protein [Candidatus Peribacteraceae bacterium]